jgi:serine phosphatase RsbU (regulator of sigma subunit)
MPTIVEESSRTPSRQRRSVALAAPLIAVAVLGSIATVSALRLERNSAQELEARAVELATLRLGAELERTVSGLRGASSLAVDGAVPPAMFETFAGDVIDDSLYRFLALVQVVPGADRAAFESSTAITITDVAGAGELVPAAERDEYYVVVQIVASAGSAAPNLGFDIRSDPVRRNAADASIDGPTPVISDPIRMVSGGEPAIFLIHDIRSDDGEPIAFVASGLLIDDLVASAGPEPERLSLALDGKVLSGEERGTRRDVEVGDRIFSIWFDDDSDPNLLTPLLIGAATAALVAIGVLLARRDIRQTKRLREVAERNRAMAMLGDHLSKAITPEDVADATLAASAGILGATSSALVTLTTEVRSQPDDARSWWAQPPSPLAAVMSDAVTRGLGPGRGGSSFWGAARAAGMRSGLALPLCSSNGQSVGSLGFAWTEELSHEDLDQLEVIGRTLSELVSGALERSQFGEIVASSATGLAALAEQLVAAPTAETVRQILEEGVAPTVRGERSMVIDASEAPPTWPPSTLCARIAPPSSDTPWLLVAEFGDVVGPVEAQRAVLETIADLAEQTLHRLSRTEQEHQLIVELQRDVLSPPPVLDAWDLAVGYEPAMDLVGLGGDFYDVVEADDGSVHFIIGDIAGHGPEAVVMMAQLQSLMHELLRAGVEPNVVLQQADAHLARRRFVATAQIIRYDPVRRTVTLTNAGHPFPVLRTATGAELWRTGHRPLLGLAVDPPMPAADARSVDPGDVLVMYTDGLVEMRTEVIDAGMERMRRLVEASPSSASDDLVHEILRASTTLRPGGPRIDDAAVVAFRAV